jgi:hypothetical protein
VSIREPWVKDSEKKFPLLHSSKTVPDF